MAVLVGGLAGCGGSGSLPRSAATQPSLEWRPSGWPPPRATRPALRPQPAKLRRMVAGLLAAGDLSAKQATAILTATAQVETQLALLTPPASENPTSTSTATTGGHPPPKPKGKGKEEGHH